jgi:tripeptide aminopeptidase
MNMKDADLFLSYVTFDTQSDETSASAPSTKGQVVFAEALVRQLHEIGMSDVSLDENGYVTATLPASDNVSANIPVVGFIAHLDTSPDMSGHEVKPRIVSYRGGDIVLNERQNIVLSSAMFPEINDYTGQDLIVTDGTTLLGADDKAGITAIVSAMKQLLENPELKHGKVRVAFTPDEEIGRGADRFDVEKFGCQWAYTVDGGAIGELEYENFNAASALIVIKGRNIHPGYAKNKMQNALQAAICFHNRLPENERPEKTEKYEGFYHLTSFGGTVENATLSYIIRDHDRNLFEAKKSLVKKIAQDMRESMHIDIRVEIKDQYYNMREKVEPHKEIVDIAIEAMKVCGVKPVVKPVRGGTDGARLSFMGLPCPNLFAGGLNFHGRYEFLPVKSLEKSKETIVQIIRLTCSIYSGVPCPKGNRSCAG